MADEVPWFDISVRRPDEAFDKSGALPAPTETYQSTHRRAEGGADIHLALEGFREGARPTRISSGLTTWEASDYLCDYLLADEEVRSKSSLRLLELGSGLGKCGLLAHRLAHPSRRYGTSLASTVLTDGDTNALQLLRRNVERNTGPGDEVISCQQLVWGRKKAGAFLFRQQYDSRFDIILGSDLVYGGLASARNTRQLFDTVDALLDDREGRFILAHNEVHGVRVEAIVRAASVVGLFHEVMKREGRIYLLCFRRSTPWEVNPAMERLQSRIAELEAENHVLRTGKGFLEDKCRCLEARCTSLRGDKEEFPRSILLSFGEDDIAGIASFLGPQDFASLSSTCKQFGLKLHKIGADPATLWHMIAYKLYKGATEREREALPVYNSGRSSYFYYKKLLELRRPLQFDRLLGWGIEHAVGNRSQIVRSNIAPSAIKTPPGIFFWACTAVSNYAMRSGKHYVTFKCHGGDDTQNDLLWLGIVRPLHRLDARHRQIFTPFCTKFVDELRELQTAEWGESDVHCCVYTAKSGQCQWTGWDFDDDPADYPDDDESIQDELRTENWQGMQRFEGGKIGMLLDYDAGTLSVFKNGVQLGVMKEGLSGSYCWMVSVEGSWICSSSDGITIARSYPLDIGGDEPCMHPPKMKQPRLLL